MKGGRVFSLRIVVYIVILTTTIGIGVLANLATSSPDRADSLVTWLALLTAGGIIFPLTWVAERQRTRRMESAKLAVEMVRHYHSTRRTAASADSDPQGAVDDFLPREEISLGLKFIFAWLELEKKMRSEAQKEVGDDYVGRPIGALIEKYADIAGLTSDDKERLRDLLRLRNALVHQGPNVDLDELKRALKELAEYQGGDDQW